MSLLSVYVVYVVCGLDGYDHFGVAEDFVVEVVAFFDNVDDEAFLRGVGGWELGDGFVEVFVEFGAFGFDGFEAFLGEDVDEFVVDELDAFFGGFGVGHGGEGALEVVDDGEDGFDHVFAAVDDEVGFFGGGALAVVFVFGVEAEVFVVDFGQFFAHFLHFVVGVGVAVVAFAALVAALGLSSGVGLLGLSGGILLFVRLFFFLSHIDGVYCFVFIV